MFRKLRERALQRKLEKAQAEADRLRDAQTPIYTAAFDRAFDKAFDLAWALMERKVTERMARAEQDIIAREEAKLENIMRNHRARVSRADSPLALQLYDEVVERYERTKHNLPAIEVERMRAQIEVLRRLVDVKETLPSTLSA